MTVSVFLQDGVKIGSVLRQVVDMSPYDGDDVCWSCGSGLGEPHREGCAYRQACELLGREP